MSTTVTTTYSVSPQNIAVPATNVVSLKANALDYFEALMETAIGDKSAYRAAIDKIEDIALDSSTVPDNQFSPSEKAKMIAELAASVVPSITSEAMKLGYTMAKEDRDAKYQYPLMTADAITKIAQANKVDSDAELVDEQANKLKHDVLMTQASLKRDYGATSTDFTASAPTLTYSNEGNKYNEALALAAKGYATYAKSYRESGEGNVGLGTGTIGTDTEYFGYTPVFSGFSKPSKTDTDDIDTSAGLTAYQTMNQWRTIKGYDDNMAQHAVNASSNMVGILASDNLNSDLTCQGLSQWNYAMNYLLNNVVRNEDGTLVSQPTSMKCTKHTNS